MPFQRGWQPFNIIVLYYCLARLLLFCVCVFFNFNFFYYVFHVQIIVFNKVSALIFQLKAIKGSFL